MAQLDGAETASGGERKRAEHLCPAPGGQPAIDAAHEPARPAGMTRSEHVERGATRFEPKGGLGPAFRGVE
jgi:hypothetical protein